MTQIIGSVNLGPLETIPDMAGIYLIFFKNAVELLRINNYFEFSNDISLRMNDCDLLHVGATTRRLRTRIKGLLRGGGRVSSLGFSSLARFLQRAFKFMRCLA